MTTADRLKKLEEMEAAAKKRLSEIAAQKKAIAAKANALAKKQERKNETRRKILAGSLVLEMMQLDESFKNGLMIRLNKYLKRSDDRAIFGLPPLPSPAAE